MGAEQEGAAAGESGLEDPAGAAVARGDLTTQVDRAYAAVEEAIVRGVLAPGSRIQEPKLATMFGVSRGSVREALGRLEGKKLVVRTPNQGARVASLSLNDVIEIFELREALEGMACRLATEHMGDADLAALDALLDRHASESQPGSDGYFQGIGDRDFHFAIAHGSRNRHLEQQICGDLYHLMRVYRYRSSTTPGRAASAAAEHRRIVAAMRERDPDKAEGLMRFHIRRSLENLQRREFVALDTRRAATPDTDD